MIATDPTSRKPGFLERLRNGGIEPGDAGILARGNGDGRASLREDAAGGIGPDPPDAAGTAGALSAEPPAGPPPESPATDDDGEPP